MIAIKRGRKPIDQKEHEKRMELYKKGMIDSDIAQKCNVSRMTIYQWRVKNGLPTISSGSPLGMVGDEMIIENLYSEGLTDKEIADKFNVTASAVWHWRKTRGYPANNRYRNHGKTGLISFEEKQEIMSLLRKII